MSRPPALVDITGPIRPGMWHYDAPYFAPEIRALPSPDWIEGEIHQQMISMPLQSGTYLETAAHVDPERELVEDLELARTTMVPAVCVAVPAGARTPVAAAPLREAIARVMGGDAIAGTALIVATGWSSHWDDPDYVSGGPFFTPDAIDVVLELAPGLLGADIPRFDDPMHPTGHLNRFFASDTLMLAPLYGLEPIHDTKGTLIAAPLRIAGVCATPVRAIWITP
jgi:arylformamidase